MVNPSSVFSGRSAIVKVYTALRGQFNKQMLNCPMRTVKALINEHGKVELLEPLTLSEERQALVTILDTPTQEPRPFGLCKGEFSVPDDFDAPLPDDTLDDFERT